MTARIFWVFGSIRKFFEPFYFDGHNLGTGKILCLFIFLHSNLACSDCRAKRYSHVIRFFIQFRSKSRISIQTILSIQEMAFAILFLLAPMNSSDLTRRSIDTLKKKTLKILN